MSELGRICGNPRARFPSREEIESPDWERRGEQVRAVTPERLCLGPSSRGGWCLMAPFLGGDDQNPIKAGGGPRK